MSTSNSGENEHRIVSDDDDDDDVVPLVICVQLFHESLYIQDMQCRL